jgi:hypothetical protein
MVNEDATFGNRRITHMIPPPLFNRRLQVLLWLIGFQASDAVFCFWLFAFLLPSESACPLAYHSDLAKYCHWCSPDSSDALFKILAPAFNRPVQIYLVALTATSNGNGCVTP